MAGASEHERGFESAMPREAMMLRRRKSGAHPLILVVDDDFHVATSVAEILRDERYIVATAPNGERALTMLKDGLRPALAVLDLNMPVVDGRGFVDAVRAEERIAAMPVVLLSAYGDVIDEALASRVQAVLHKPLHLRTLLDAVDRWCFQGRVQLAAHDR